MGRREFNIKSLLNFEFGFTNRFGFTNKKVENLDKFDNFNLAFHVGDDFQKVLQNRKNLEKILNLKYSIFMNQTHGDKICIVDDKFLNNFEDKLKNQNNQNEFLEIFPKCDALITNLPNIGLFVMVADCSPILLFDTKNIATGIVHAGRAGICKKILSKTAKKMNKKYNTQFCDLVAIVGPNIKGKCYEIGDLDLGNFNKFKCQTNLKNFDMDLALKAEFDELGIKKYEFSKICTHCNESYFSYRRDGVTGRFCGFSKITTCKNK